MLATCVEKAKLAFFWVSLQPLHKSAIHSFRECLRRCHLQPADDNVIHFMEAQQAVIQFCDRTRVENVLHGLLLSAITEWR